jgi:hypothetical protein
VRTSLLFATCAATVGVALPLPLPRAPQAPPQVFRTTSQVVSVYVTVRESSGRLVPKLPKEAFELYDNRKRVDVLCSDDVQPFTTVLMSTWPRHVGQYRRLIDSRHFVGALRDDDESESVALGGRSPSPML